jgi:hypothetical protein
MMGGACSAYEGDEKYIHFGRKNLKGRDYLVDIGVDGSVRLRWNLEI